MKTNLNTPSNAQEGLQGAQCAINGEYDLKTLPEGAQLLECWKDDSDTLQDLAGLIVDFSPRFAWQIVHLWLTKHGEVAIKRDEWILFPRAKA